MSRSYKKTPVNKDRNNKHIKKAANKKVRRAAEIEGNGAHFKKVVNGYDICDFKSGVGISFMAFLEEELKKDPVKKDWREYYRKYKKMYLNK